MKTGILYFTTCFHGFAILRHVDPFVRMLHIFESNFLIYALNCRIKSDFAFLRVIFKSVGFKNEVYI